MNQSQETGMAGIPIIPEGIDQVCRQINRELSQGKELWVYGSASLDIAEIELAGFPFNAVKIGINQAVISVPCLDYCFAIDYSALGYFTPRIEQKQLTLIFPRAPQILPPGKRIGKTLDRYEGKYAVPPGFRKAVELCGITVALFDYKPLPNPGGGTFYNSWSVHPDSFYSFKGAKNRRFVINNLGRLNPVQKEEATAKMARLLFRKSAGDTPSSLYGIRAGRAILPLICLLMRTKAKQIHLAGFSCDNADYHMTNLVVSHLASLYGKQLVFHQPGNSTPFRITGKGFEPVLSSPQPATLRYPVTGKKTGISILLPFFIGEPGGVSDENIRSRNLTATLNSISRFRNHPNFDIEVLLLEASENGMSKINGEKNHFIFKKAPGVVFPKQFLFLVGLEILKRQGKSSEIAILHDIDIPIIDADFFIRVYYALTEKKVLHNVIKAIYLPEDLNDEIMSQIEATGSFNRGEASAKLYERMMKGHVSNEVSRYLFCSSRRLIEIEKHMMTVVKNGTPGHLTVGQRNRCFWQLPLTDRVAIRYMWNLQWAYGAQQHVNYFFPGFSWSGRVDDLIETIIISSLYTGWGFEDSAFMETARKLWGDTGNRTDKKPSNNGDCADGVGCIAGPAGLLSHRNVCVGDSLHQFHPTLHGIPLRKTGMSRESYFRELFAFELKKTIQLAFIEHEDTNGAMIRQMNGLMTEVLLRKMVEDTIKLKQIPSLDMIDNFSCFFEFAKPGEPGTLDIEKLLNYYDYWKQKGESWRFYDIPSKNGGQTNFLFRENLLFCLWAHRKNITCRDITLHLKPKLF